MVSWKEAGLGDNLNIDYLVEGDATYSFRLLEDDVIDIIVSTVDSPEGVEDEVDVFVGELENIDGRTINNFGDEDALLLDLDDTVVITDAVDAAGSLFGVQFLDPATGETAVVTLTSEDGEIISASELQTTQTEDGVAIHVGPFEDTLITSIATSGSDGKIDDPEASWIIADANTTKVEVSGDNKFVFANRIGAEENLVIEDLKKQDVLLTYDGTTSTTQIEECLIYDIGGASLMACAMDTGGSPTTANPEPNFNAASNPSITIITTLGTLGSNLDVIDLGGGAYKLTDGADWEEIVNVEDKNGVGVEGLENMFQFLTPEEQAADLV